eukprot:8862152-Alexandrium_andersonii.AAC.1
MMLESKPDHIYGDITDFLSDEIRDIAKSQSARLAFYDLRRVVVDGHAKALRKRTATCATALAR